MKIAVPITTMPGRWRRTRPSNEPRGTVAQDPVSRAAPGSRLKKEHPVKRTILIAFLFVVLQPLLTGAGILAKWALECGGGACAGTVRATSPFGAPRDVLLTALAVAMPYLLVVFIAAVAWLLAGRTLTQPAVETVPTSSAIQAVDRPATRSSVPTVGAGQTLDHPGALPNGKSRQSKAYGVEGARATMRQGGLEANL